MYAVSSLQMINDPNMLSSFHGYHHRSASVQIRVKRPRTKTKWFFMKRQPSWGQWRATFFILARALVEVCALPSALKVELRRYSLVVVIYMKFCRKKNYNFSSYIQHRQAYTQTRSPSHIFFQSTTCTHTHTQWQPFSLSLSLSLSLSNTHSLHANRKE